MSSENYVGIIMAENLKLRPRGVGDAHTVEIP